MKNEISFKNDVLPLKNKLYRLALRITMDTGEAEDVVQDTLIRVWNKRDEWDELESIEAYCMTICKNLSLDRHEKKGVLRDANDDDSVIPHITEPEFKQLVEQGIVEGGMIPKLENAFNAIHSGVKKVNITLSTAIDGKHGTIIE